MDLAHAAARSPSSLSMGSLSTPSDDVPTETGVPRCDRPTWIEIDTTALRGNVKLLKELVGPSTELMAIVKANGYGHGAVAVAREAVASGAEWCGVACLGEALELRRARVRSPILILGYTPAWLACDAVLNGVSLTVYDASMARDYSLAAGKVDGVARLHVKVDTGMGRLGLPPEEVPAFLSELSHMPHLAIEGISTHFATSDEADKEYALLQLARFNALLSGLRARGIVIPLVHMANSAATIVLPEARFGLARTGLAMYGVNPSRDVLLPKSFRRVLTLKTTIAQVRTYPPGSYIGYGCSYQTEGEETVAVIPIGYADGFRRNPNWGEVLVNGCRAPIVGRVCMDQTMIRVSHVPGVTVGDEVVLIGRQGREMITAEDVAGRLGAIVNEVLVGLGGRIPRIAVPQDVEEDRV